MFPIFQLADDVFFLFKNQKYHITAKKIYKNYRA